MLIVITAPDLENGEHPEATSWAIVQPEQSLTLFQDAGDGIRKPVAEYANGAWRSVRLVDEPSS